MSPTSDSTPLIDGLLTKVADNDPEETGEWRESLDALIREKGGPRARYILLSMLAEARKKNVSLPIQTTTPYINTIDKMSIYKYKNAEKLTRQRNFQKCIRDCLGLFNSLP